MWRMLAMRGCFWKFWALLGNPSKASRRLEFRKNLVKFEASFNVSEKTLSLLKRFPQKNMHFLETLRKLQGMLGVSFLKTLETICRIWSQLLCVQDVPKWPSQQEVVFQNFGHFLENPMCEECWKYCCQEGALQKNKHFLEGLRKP